EPQVHLGCRARPAGDAFPAVIQGLGTVGGAAVHQSRLERAGSVEVAEGADRPLQHAVGGLLTRQHQAEAGETEVAVPTPLGVGELGGRSRRASDTRVISSRSVAWTANNPLRTYWSTSSQ